MHIFFRYPIFLKHWSDAHENFRHCETKNFWRENMKPPSSSINLFETKNSPKNSRIPWRKFSALWDIKTSTESRDKPPFFHKFLSVTETFRKTEGFLYKAFRFGPVRQKISTKPWCAPSHGWKFSIKEFFWNTKVFSNQIFRFSMTKTSTENRDTPPPPLIHKKFFPTSNFLKHRMVPWRSFFGPVRETKFRQNREACPLLCLKFFDTRNLSKHRSLSALKDKKISKENLDSSPPPLLSINFFDTGNFVKQRRDPLRSFSALWDNKVSIENRYIPLLGIKFLDTRNFLKHRRDPRRKFSPLWDKFFSTENRDTLLHKVKKSVVELMFVGAFWKLISKQ